MESAKLSCNPLPPSLREVARRAGGSVLPTNDIPVAVPDPLLGTNACVDGRPLSLAQVALPVWGARYLPC